MYDHWVSIASFRSSRSRAIVDRFADLMDLRGDKSRLDAYFGRGGGRQQRRKQQPADTKDAGDAACTRGVQAAEAGGAAAEAAAQPSRELAQRVQPGTPQRLLCSV
jgi:hypothetical protein